MLLAAIMATIYIASLAEIATAGCQTKACDARVKARMLEHRYQLTWRAAPPAMRAHLRRIAMCESTNRETAISANGLYRGLVQFDYATFASVGGRGDPAAASRWEQWARAVMLYRKRGAQPWPICGR